jgi:long-chain acyl-CoA synthetase
VPLIDLFRSAARCNPGKTALICRDRELTYAELDRHVAGLARWFVSQGLRAGDRVAVQGINTIETAELLLACFHAGLIAVPVNVRLKPAEIAYVLEHSQPKLCFTQAALASAMQAACAELAAPPPVRLELPEGIAGDDLPAPSDDTLALILYTSGTTARPKGVVHTLASLEGSARTILPTGIDHTSILMVTVPLMHASGLTCSTIPALTAGATTVLIPAFEPGAVLDAIERYRCTWGIGLPAMMQFVTKEQEERPRDMSSLLTWIAGGDAVPVSLQERFGRAFGIPLQEGHAMSESVVIAWNRPQAIRNGSIGQAADGVELQVFDFSGRPVPDGTIGEMAVRSPSMFHSYWRDPVATEGVFVDGWFTTGDLVRRDGQGFIWFEGRRKEVIIRGGSNISPQEVEEAIYRHPAVMEVGVIGVPCEVYGERLLACVSVRAGQTVTESELQDFVRHRLADYKVPERIVFLSELPKGITGKVQRRALKDMAMAASA